MQQFSYTVQDELGLHARPAGLLVKEIQKFGCNATLSTEEKSADAKRILGVMQLAVKQGQTVNFAFEGEDEATACAEIKTFCEQNL